MRTHNVKNPVTQSSDGWVKRLESAKPIQAATERVPFGSLKVVAIIAACAVFDVVMLGAAYWAV